jgi:glycosyltransferase involved in cell wall biosynthesis
LLFPPGNVEDLAQKITCLADDPGLRRRLALAGHRTVVEKFTAMKMIDEIESYLQEIALASAQSRPV